jgi:hypothetical protein
MTNIEVEVEQRLTDESSDDEQQEETVQDNVEVPTPKAEVDNILNNISSKAVKQLSRDERSKLISDFENGVENQYFKVMKMKNGQIRITKRFNPLPTPDKAPEVINNKINKQYNNKLLTNEQLLLEHIFDLERKYEQMRLKHKKLKKRYNKLETDLFDDEPLDIKEITQETVNETPNEPVNEPVNETPNERMISNVRTIKRGIRKQSWRDVISKY